MYCGRVVRSQFQVVVRIGHGFCRRWTADHRTAILLVALHLDELGVVRYGVSGRCRLQSAAMFLERLDVGKQILVLLNVVHCLEFKLVQQLGGRSCHQS